MSDDLRPRRARTRDIVDDGTRCVGELLSALAGRVKAATGRAPAISPPEGGMVRLGSRDRASYVWFLPCHEPDTVTGGPKACNHGIGVDRQYGQYEVRAWAHGAPGVHDLSIHTHVVTAELLETAAKLVGIPLAPPPHVGALDVECPVCLRPDVQHDGLQLETHRTPAGHPCDGSGRKINRRRPA